MAEKNGKEKDENEHLGNAQIVMNNRISVPKNILAKLDVKVGDFLGFYETPEKEIIVKKMVLVQYKH
jgi:bifunctional DNA-binding transcriptional regulator/antitoxin component of YhaV-PrlF toxin-antitoxin module